MWILLFIIHKDGWTSTEQKKILERLYKIFQLVIFEHLDIPYSFAGINFQIWFWKRRFCFCFHFKNAHRDFSDSSVVKNPPLNAANIKDSIPGLERSSEGGNHTRLLPGESHGQRSLVGYNP